MTTPKPQLQPIQKITIRKDGSRRVQLICPEQSITDTDSARELSMESIKRKLEKGLPVTYTNDSFHSLKPLRYTNLQDALDFQQQVAQQFESLPSGLRKEMGNDIRNFETYVSDPKNNDTLVKYGLAKKREATNTDVVNAVNDLKTKFNTDDQQNDSHTSNKTNTRSQKQP